MTWADFYLFCFGVGFFFSVVAAVTGHLHLDFGGHGPADVGDVVQIGGDGPADFGDLGHVGGDSGTPHHTASSGGHHVSPFNLGTVAAFLAWFGGTGFLIARFYRMWFISTLGLAILAGGTGGWIVYLFLSKVLLRSREEMDPADYEMVGVLGTATGMIRPGGTGEILFSRDGARRASPARSEDGRAIGSGEDVVVTRYENGIAYVRRWDDLTGELTDAQHG